MTDSHSDIEEIQKIVDALESSTSGDSLYSALKELDVRLLFYMQYMTSKILKDRFMPQSKSTCFHCNKDADCRIDIVSNGKIIGTNEATVCDTCFEYFKNNKDYLLVALKKRGKLHD